MRIVISPGTGWSASASLRRSSNSSASSVTSFRRTSGSGLDAFFFSASTYCVRKLCASMMSSRFKSAPSLKRWW